MLNGMVQRSERKSEIGKIIRQHDLVALGNGDGKRRPSPRNDGLVEYLKLGKTQSIVDLRIAHLRRIEAIEVAPAAENDMAVGRSGRRSLAEDDVAHVVVEIIIMENLPPGVEPRHGIVGSDPQIARGIFGNSHADVAGQPPRTVIADEARNARIIVTDDEIQPTAISSQPDASLRILVQMDDVVVA